jgi:hypothetical protein
MEEERYPPPYKTEEKDQMPTYQWMKKVETLKHK